MPAQPYLKTASNQFIQAISELNREVQDAQNSYGTTERSIQSELTDLELRLKGLQAEQSATTDDNRASQIQREIQLLQQQIDAKKQELDQSRKIMEQTVSTKQNMVNQLTQLMNQINALMNDPAVQ